MPSPPPPCRLADFSVAGAAPQPQWPWGGGEGGENSDEEGGGAATLSPPRVVAVYAGAGRIAGHNFSNPQWVPGRLWQYEGGGLAFLYMWPGSQVGGWAGQLLARVHCT